MSGEVADEAPVTATLAGDERAFEELVARYRGSICALAFRRLRRFEEARDIAQAALVTAFTKPPGGRAKRGMKHAIYWQIGNRALSVRWSSHVRSGRLRTEVAETRPS